MSPDTPPIDAAHIDTVPALDIGGSHVTAALVDPAAGAVVPGSVHRSSLDAAATAEDIVDGIVGTGARLASAAGATWGVAVPGPFDYQAGRAWFAGVGKFESLYGVDLGSMLTARLPGPPASVRFLNDADAFLLGEWRFGAASGHDRCVGLTLGTGIGSAFLADGAIRQQGPVVPPEGRVDLLRIDGEPLEDTVSSRAIRAAYQRRTGMPPPDVAEIARRGATGDATAAAVLSEAFTRLGEALSPWLRAFGTTVLVVGGSMVGSWPLIGPPLRAALGGDHGRPLTVTVAAEPEHATLLGAAIHAASAHAAHEP